MNLQEYFYDHYDSLMPKMCDGYESFLDVAAGVVPSGVRSVAEFGIGTGNLSQRIQGRIPGIEIYGVDKNEKTLAISASKLSNFHPYCRDFFDGDFPPADCFVTSLAMHHLSTGNRRSQLLSLAESSNVFVNFDFALFDGRTYDDVIVSSMRHCAKSFGTEQLALIEREMRANDNYMSLAEQVELFESGGFEFRIHEVRDPFIVYSVVSKNS